MFEKGVHDLVEGIFKYSILFFYLKYAYIGSSDDIEKAKISLIRKIY